jgi:uncharacterized membrane protein
MTTFIVQFSFILGLTGISISAAMGVQYDPANSDIIVWLGVASIYLFLAGSIISFFWHTATLLDLMKGLIILMATIGYTTVLSKFCDMPWGTDGDRRILLLRTMGVIALLLPLIGLYVKTSKSDPKSLRKQAKWKLSKT